MKYWVARERRVLKACSLRRPRVVHLEGAPARGRRPRLVLDFLTSRMTSTWSFDFFHSTSWLLEWLLLDFLNSRMTSAWLLEWLLLDLLTCSTRLLNFYCRHLNFYCDTLTSSTWLVGFYRRHLDCLCSCPYWMSRWAKRWENSFSNDARPWGSVARSVKWRRWYWVQILKSRLYSHFV